MPRRGLGEDRSDKERQGDMAEKDSERDNAGRRAAARQIGIALRRREFLALGAVAGGGLLLRGWGGRSGVAPRSSRRAAQVDVPTVDQLILTNVVDNTYDIFAKAGQIGSVTVRRTPVPAPPQSGSPLISEHGLAYHLQSTRGDEQQTVLLDFALTRRSLTNNYRALQIDPTQTTVLVLSHGHNDHYGALPDLLGRLPDWAAGGLTLYAGGGDTFCQRWVLTPDGGKLDYGQLDRAALEALGVSVNVTEQPTVVAGHALTSGQIPRVTAFEKPPATARVQLGAPGTDCSASMHFPPGAVQVEAAPGELVPDVFAGEHATAYAIKDRGLVIISSCGHAGIINTVRQVQAVAGIDKVHAIVGGFHLAPAPDEIVNQTVAGFKDIDPDYILPMHCTGQNTIFAIEREMPAKLILPSTGTRVVFGG
jgi:7,8-dihydropterin-6-yl-methyl-4-(beta-D-ribofuranosyl)aminobenzene 5'-phosphate synthase